MTKSDSIKEIASAISKAQAEMGGAIKDSNNPFFKSSYADLASVISVIKKPMTDNGLAYIQAPVFNGDIAGVTTLITHTSGEWFESELLLPIKKTDAQSVGSCVTYARRYSLQSLLGVPAVDDDGNAASMPATKQLPPYSQEKFDENYSLWQEKIAEGKLSKDKLFNMLCSKFSVSEIQNAKIKGMKE